MRQVRGDPGFQWALVLGFVLLGFVQLVSSTGQIEVHFLQYQDDCDEDWGTNKCDPMFSFCLSRPQTGSLSVSKSKCQYDATGETRDHYHNTNNIDFEHSNSILGHPNPWVVKVEKFYDPSVMLVIMVRDADIFEHDHLATWGYEIRDTVWMSREESQWKAHIMSKGDYIMHFKIRMYCDPFWNYNSACDVYCRPQDTSTGHYTCSSAGDKVCMKGWMGPDCTTDVNECNLRFCARGTCQNTQGDYICTCPDDYQGKNCTERKSPCYSQPCQNGGTCYIHNTEHQYICQCRGGWEGNNCEIRPDPCRLKPCYNGGSCQSTPDRLQYACSCSYPFTGKHCENVETTTLPTTTTTTTTTTTPTTTTTEEPTTTTTTEPTTTSTSTTTTSTTTTSTTIPDTTTSTTIPDTTTTSTTIPDTTTTSTTITTTPSSTTTSVTESTTNETSAHHDGMKQYQRQADEDHFNLWYLAIIAGVLLLVVVGIFAFLIIKRRKEKAVKENAAGNTVVAFNGHDLAFENTMYADINRANLEIERNVRELPPLPVGPPPTTPTDDELFNPVKPFYSEVDETQGAVGGCDSSDTKVKGKTPECEIKSNGHLGSLVQPKSERADINPYADFNSLKRESQNQKGQEDYQDEGHYNDLDEIALALRGQRDPGNPDNLSGSQDFDISPHVSNPTHNTLVDNHYHVPPPRISSDYMTPTPRAERPVSQVCITDEDHPYDNPKSHGQDVSQPPPLPPYNSTDIPQVPTSECPALVKPSESTQPGSEETPSSTTLSTPISSDEAGSTVGNNQNGHLTDAPNLTQNWETFDDDNIEDNDANNDTDLSNDEDQDMQEDLVQLRKSFAIHVQDLAPGDSNI